MKTLAGTDKDEISKMIGPILWDYNIDPYEFYLVAVGERALAGHFDQNKAWARLLDNLPWYDLIALFGLDGVKAGLTREAIAALRFEDTREKYEFIRRILHSEPLPLSGWGPEYREKVRRTLISDRWHRIRQETLRP